MVSWKEEKNMRLQKKHIEKYQAIYEKIYNEKISYEEAYTQCMDLVLFCMVATKPLARENQPTLEK